MVDRNCVLCGGIGLYRTGRFGTLLVACSCTRTNVESKRLRSTGACTECVRENPRPHAHSNGNYGGHNKPKYLKVHITIMEAKNAGEA